MLTQSTAVFITGAAGGIGSATARLFIENGHKVAVADLDYAAAETLADALGPDAQAIPLDVTSPSSWNGALSQAQECFGRIDIIVNNAGLLDPGYLRDHRQQALEAMIAVNLTGVANGFRAGARLFEAQGSGHFITLGSMTAFVALKGQAVYSATKHGVRALHYAFAMEMAETPVRFSIIHPGTVKTPLFERQKGIESSALSFAEPPIAPVRIAKAIFKAAQTGARERIIPGPQGFFARFIGIFPGLLAAALKGAWLRGLVRMTKL